MGRCHAPTALPLATPPARVHCSHPSLADITWAAYRLGLQLEDEQAVLISSRVSCLSLSLLFWTLWMYRKEVALLQLEASGCAAKALRGQGVLQAWWFSAHFPRQICAGLITTYPPWIWQMAPCCQHSSNEGSKTPHN